MAVCTRCGTDLPDHARFCPACGAATADTARTTSAPLPPSPPPPLPPLRPHRGGVGGMILPAMIVIAAIVIGFFLWSQRDGMRPIAGNDREAVAEAPPVADEDASAVADDRGDTASVAAIDAAFRADPAGAQRRYAGPVTVDGTLVSVTAGGNPSLSLEGRSRFNHVIANVADAAPFAGKAAGERVRLACRSVTALAGTTMLRACVPA